MAEERDKCKNIKYKIFKIQNNEKTADDMLLYTYYVIFYCICTSVSISFII